MFNDKISKLFFTLNGVVCISPANLKSKQLCYRDAIFLQFFSVIPYIEDMESPVQKVILHENLERIDDLMEVYCHLKNDDDKLQWLFNLPQVEENLTLFPPSWIEALDSTSQSALFALFSISPKEQLAQMDFRDEAALDFFRFVDELKKIEAFYEPIGGILGYQRAILKLVHRAPKEEEALWESPPGYDLENIGQEEILAGLEVMPRLFEIYPVGGAGDRLNLQDKKSLEPLPAALLPFLGRSLLEGLIRDLQGREYFYEKLFGKKLITPVALMTSQEKNNSTHLKALLERHNYFGRSKDSFFLFEQPLAPMVSKEGNWSLNPNWSMVMKPGGHGVIWKVAKDTSLFSWLRERGRDVGLVRQINNPICGLDHTLSTFVGIGATNEKGFGFLSCPRLVNSAEGVDVLREEKEGKKWSASIINIEYTDFAHHGIVDEAVNGTGHSKYPSNTNVLFIQLDALAQKIDQNPLPGLVYNPKNGAAGRLESLMQSIAEEFSASLETPIKGDEWKKLPSFIAYNSRKKSISVTKRAYVEGEKIHETPHGCLYDYLSNMYDLFSSCQMELPKLASIEEHDIESPPFLITIHPALGPHWSIIRQKISGGVMAPGAELDLELAELEMRNCTIDGSLRIRSADLQGRCQLRNVCVKNRGVDWSGSGHLFEGEMSRSESLDITLHGCSEFVAEDIELEGDCQIEVADGERLICRQSKDGVEFIKEKLDDRGPLWSYQIDASKQIRIQK